MVDAGDDLQSGIIEVAVPHRGAPIIRSPRPALAPRDRCPAGSGSTRRRFIVPLAGMIATVAIVASGLAWVPAASGRDPDTSPGPAERLRSEIDARTAKIAQLDGRQAALASRLLEIEVAIAALRERRAENERALAVAEGELAVARQQIQSAAARENELKGVLAQLVLAAYDESRTSPLERFLSSDLLGFLVQIGQIGTVEDELQRQAAAIREVRAAAAAWSERAERLVTQLAGTRAALEEDARALDTARVETERLLDALAREQIAQQSRLAVAQDALEAIGLTEAEALAEQAALARKAQAAALEPGPTGPAGAGPPPPPAPAPSPSPTGTSTATPGVPATPALTPTPTPTPVPSTAPPAGTITFFGRGTDHGLGLSQWGARGRAEAGQSAAEIIAAYYRGTTIGQTDPTQPVRVLLLSGFRPSGSIPARLRGLNGPWAIDGVAGPFPDGATLDLEPAAEGWQMRVRASDGTPLFDAPAPGSLVLRPASDATRLQVVFKPSYYDTYRGAIRIIVTSTGLTVVNEVGLDEYLLGVVPAEMPSTWPQEALRAQAMAARSYAVAHLRRGVGLYDVDDTTRSQVYLGALYEKATTTAAVQATAGAVVMSGSSVANTLFHSTAGGATENNENVYVAWDGRPLAAPVSYLSGINDRAPDGRPYDAGSPWATWQSRAYTLDELSSIFAQDARTAVGQLVRLDLSRRGVSGRLITVTLIGSAATKTVSGSYFKYVFNVYSPVSDPPLRSTLFDTAPIP